MHVDKLNIYLVFEIYYYIFLFSDINIKNIAEFYNKYSIWHFRKCAMNFKHLISPLIVLHLRQNKMPPVNGLVLWFSRLNCYLQCQHPKWTWVQSLAAPFESQFPASAPEKPTEDSPYSWAPVTRVGDKMEFQSYSFQLL